MGMFQEFSRNRSREMQDTTEDDDDADDQKEENDGLISGSMFQRADDYGGGF